MKNLVLLTFLILVLALSSCKSSYVTPGSSVNISQLADEDIAKLLSNQPAAQFPVNMAIARIQAPQYTNYRHRGYAPAVQNTSYSMVLTRDAEEEEAFEKLSDMIGVKKASPFNRLLLPYNYSSIKDLRLAAAKMKAGVLLVYTFDTEFIVDQKNCGPQNVLALGYLKNKEVKVVTTASAAIFDVQTEYLYGLAEASVQELRNANTWKKQEEVDALRVETERKAFDELVEEIEDTWGLIQAEYHMM